MPERRIESEQPARKKETTEEERRAWDIRNAEARREIALKQNAEYRRAEILALRVLGPGWEPSMKLTLIRIEDCGPTGKDDPAPVPVAVAYKVRRDRGEERQVHYVRETDPGDLLASEKYEDVFGALLTALHPTKTMEIKGQRIAVKAFQLYHSALELYHPRSAEQLGALREGRERGKEERANQKFDADNPLLAWGGIHRQDIEDD